MPRKSIYLLLGVLVLGMGYGKPRPNAPAFTKVEFPLEHRWWGPPPPMVLARPCMFECTQGTLIHVTLCHGATFCLPDGASVGGDVEALCRHGAPVSWMTEESVSHILFDEEKCSDLIGVGGEEIDMTQK